MNALLSRRGLLLGLGTLIVPIAPGCGNPGFSMREGDALPEQTPSGEAPARAHYTDNVDCVMDVLLPEERDADGRVVSPGARSVGTDALLDVTRFVRLAVARGFLPPLPEDTTARLEALGDAGFRAFLDADLDVLAAGVRPLTPFRELPAATREQLVADAFDDPTRGPLLQIVRAACFTAYLGATSSDRGLVAVGQPPFEDLPDGLAVSGYPRTTNGAPDDYTANRAPAPTPGEDLATILDARGDLF